MICVWKTPIPAGRIATVLASAMLLAGCSQERPTQSATGGGSAADDQAAKSADVEDEVAKEKPAPPVEAEPKPELEPDYDVADVGADDAKAGSTIGGGILTEPLHQRFHIMHRMEFTKIEHAMNLFKASNGHFPKSHEEFMEKIIRENRITLPELYDGWDYFYDAEDHTLKKRKET